MANFSNASESRGMALGLYNSNTTKCRVVRNGTPRNSSPSCVRNVTRFSLLPDFGGLAVAAVFLLALCNRPFVPLPLPFLTVLIAGRVNHFPRQDKGFIHRRQ